MIAFPRFLRREGPSPYRYDHLVAKEAPEDITKPIVVRTASDRKRWLLYFALAGSLLLAIVEGVVLATLIFRPTKYQTPAMLTSSKSPVPQFDVEIRPFQDDPRFQDLRTADEVDRAWASFIRPHAGFVTVDEPRRYDLVPNRAVAGTENSYMVSFYHQLHCLRELQMQHVHLLNNRSVDLAEHQIERRHREFDWNHAEHCFSYIRQGIQCSGDTTLEGPDRLRVPGESPLRGWGVQHQCRDWRQMQGWMRENAAF